MVDRGVFEETSRKREQPVFATAYLLAYNVCAAFLWSVTLLMLARGVIRHIPLVHKETAKLIVGPGTWKSVFDEMHTVMVTAQSMAILEVFHPMLGLIRAPILSTLMQVASRLFIVYGVLRFEHAHWAAVTVVLAWSIVEIPRYSFYAIKLLHQQPGQRVPYELLWLRYSLFIVLYPLGITCELMCVYYALPFFVARPSLYSISMPNSINFSFSYAAFLYFVVAAYLPGSPFLFAHMLHMRKKNLSSTATRQKAD